MAMFATLDRENNIIKTEEVADAVITDGDGVEQEQLGINFLIQLYGVGWYKRIFPTPSGTTDIVEE